ncbi:B12-binding domain-containing radical SAM protein [Pelagibacterales bacterium SAG-MED15]|nr:B12-binding domain-containing radical SAM protein [Pelagibacterales bacterium SAG-MED15]
MKILFINPSLRLGSEFLFLPVGLGYVMTYIKQAGYTFDLLDIDGRQLQDDYVENYFKENKYDVICVGSIVTHYRWIKWCINTIKKYQPDCKVIVGNSVGGSIPEVLFQTSKVDIVIYGEAEITLKETLDAIKSNESFGTIVEPRVEIPHPNKGYPATIKGEGIAGLIYRTKNNLIVNNGKRKAVRNIDDFPFPDWELFDVQHYLKKGIKHGASHSWFYPKDKAVTMPINTARGCVFKCTFCHYVFWHDPYRHRSAENVIAEIKNLKEKYGANFFNFWDELSFHKIGPAEKFLDKLIEADLKIHFTCAIRADLMGKDVDPKGNPIPRERRLNLAKKFVEAGCVSAGYSLESGSNKILESMNKKVKSEYFHEQVEICREAGLITNTSLVIGYPEETKETIDETMSKLEALNVYPSAGFLLPLPETGMWKHAIENGFITDIDKFLTAITERQDFSLNMTKMDEEELKAYTLGWLDKLNKKFGNLDKNKLLRTGGYDKHSKHQEKAKLVDRNKTTKDSLNYGAQEGILR